MSNVYEIGIKIGMQNAVSPVLALLAKDVLSLDNKVAGLIKRFETLSLKQKAALTGGVGLAAGVATLNVYGKIVDKGNELIAVQRRMAQAGVDQKEIAEATAKAYEMSSKFKNTGLVENLKLINDARSTFGSQHDATHHVDEFIKAESFLKAYQGGKGMSDSHGLGQEIIAAMKSGEIAGKVSPAEMKEHVAQLVAMRVAYGNNVKIGDYLTAQRAGGVALRNTDDAFRYGIFPALVQENGPGAGVMTMTAFNKIAAGVGNRTQALRAMESLGLLNEENVQYDKNGRAVRLKNPSGIKGSDMFARNPFEWVTTVLKPLLEVKAKGDHVAEAQLISQLFPDRNAAKAVTEMLQQEAKLRKDAVLQQQARNEYLKNGGQEGSWDYQKQAFTAQVKSFVETIGAPMVAGATQNLKGITEALGNMVTWAKDANPAVLKELGNGIMVLGAGLGAAGLTALLAAMGPAGWIVGGLVALGAAAVVWGEDIKSFFKGLPDKMREGFAELVKAGEAVATVIKGVGDAIANALAALGQRIREAVINAVPGLKNFSDLAAPQGGAANAGRKAGEAIGGAFKNGAGGPTSPYSNGAGGDILKRLHDKRSDAGGGNRTAWNGVPVGAPNLTTHQTITLDGEVVHRSVINRTLASAEHVRQAPHHDGWSGYVGPDAQFATA